MTFWQEIVGDMTHWIYLKTDKIILAKDPVLAKNRVWCFKEDVFET